MTILGIAMSHDASAALTTNDGTVLFAIAEERISRLKNHVGIPFLAIESVIAACTEDVEKVIFGTQSTLTTDDYLRLIVTTQKNPSNPIGKYQQTFPSFMRNSSVAGDPKLHIEKLLKDLFPRLVHAEFIWINHHNSHLGCALGATNSSSRILLVSLDGDGDGESGAIATFKESKLVSECRIDQLDSLGHLYSAVTERYNFQANKHEGKITGLAAFGKHSSAVEVLSEHIDIYEGKLSIRNLDSLKMKIAKKSMSMLGLSYDSGSKFHQIVSLAESQTVDYPDLAFAVQEVLENSVLEIISYWRSATQMSSIGLAGGVFANVKLNQKIAELKEVRSIDIFPNMGDGGVALGAIWFHLQELGKLSTRPLYQNMYLAPPTDRTDETLWVAIQNSKEFEIDSWDSLDSLAKTVAQVLVLNKTVGIHSGDMEFGPRALGNRTLLVNPMYSENLEHVNARLKRTEFMPFAPVVTKEHFSDFFVVGEEINLDPFNYMTMTCLVRQDKRKLIPGVVHVDGTARPQIVSSDSNPLIHAILVSFSASSGIPVLVNTSLNIHEEPINYKLKDSLKALKSGAIDFLVFRNNIISYKGTQF
jgi:carbamoyltransferase